MSVKIAIVHEWFITYAGSEKVLAAMLSEYPDADVFCLVDFLSDEDRARIAGKHPTTSFLQRIPFARRIYKNLLPLMPLAVEQFDLSHYDVIISNSHAVAKGVITGPDQLHICYCYTPMRYAWDLQHQYLAEARMRGLHGAAARWILNRMRIWDVRTASGVDHFIACSKYIARRIKKTYRRDASVIYPNVAVEDFAVGHKKNDFYLTASRMVPYKKMRLIVEAFARMPDRKLVVIGDGPQFKEAKAIATSNVALLGYQPFEVLKTNLQEAKAFIFAAEEDFGIAPLEASACGTPVLAFGKGGASETVSHGVTGLHFHEQSADAICDIVERFETTKLNFDPQRLRAHAEQFSTALFRKQFRSFVDSAWAAHQRTLRGDAPQLADLERVA
jgi:glycosyltransferase involved in cell wall biosynthesis